MAEPEPELWVGSRKITAEDLELIRWTVRRFGALSRFASAIGGLGT